LGRDVYQNRIARIGKNPTNEQREEIRKKLISVYFDALAGNGYKANGEKPWEIKIGPMQLFQNKTRTQIMQAIETPEREMRTTLFRRGVEKLVTEMKEVSWRNVVNRFFKKIGFSPLLKQKTLYNALRVHELKKELQEVRET